MIVLDASAAIELLLGTVRGRRVADRVEADRGSDLVSPELLDVECLSALARLSRAGQVSSSDADTAAAALKRLPALRLSHLALTADAWRLRDRVRLADGFYVAAAVLVHAPLLTCDRRLASAPLPEVDVLVVA